MALFRKTLHTLTLPARLALRSQQISFILSAHGVAGTLTSLGLEVGKRGLRWVGGQAAQPRPLDAVFGRDLALTLAKLGPTFIKLGQLLATRPDVIGEPVADELKVLFNRVPPVPFKQIQECLRIELGERVVRQSFAHIEPTPLASASLSQTHRAELRDGTPVILKVQKKGVDELVRLDLLLLESFVRPLDLALGAVGRRLGLTQMLDDFKTATLREIDYREEARNIDRFRKNYRRLLSSSDILFPKYFPKLTTEKVIALEPMHGSRVADLERGSTVARRAASLGLAAVLEQIFDHGFFHADPHAGNLFFMEEEGRLGFIDLGMVGQLHPDDKRRFLKVLLAILKRDRKSLAEALYQMGTPSKRTKFAPFEKEVQALLDEVAKTGVDNLKIDVLFNRLLAVARRNGLTIPNRYVLMIRSCLMIEGVAKSLDPQISLFKVATPIVAKSLMKTYHPLVWMRRFFR